MSVNEGGPRIPGINYANGLAYSETPEIFYSMLQGFYADIEKQSAAIRRALKNEELTELERELHSLKSSARLIGADTLSQMAEELERYAKEGDLKSLRLRAPALIVQYRSYLSILEPYAKKKSENKEKLDKETRESLLEALCMELEVFDLDGALDIVERLENSELPESEKEKYEGLFSAVSEVEYEDAQALAKELLLDKE